MFDVRVFKRSPIRPQEILNGKGALQNGGRWNAPGSFSVVYGSTSGAVALDESEANDRYYGIISHPGISAMLRERKE